MKLLTLSLCIFMLDYSFAEPKLHISKENSFVDEAIEISVIGALPCQDLTIKMSTHDDEDEEWLSSGSFKADEQGCVQLGVHPSIQGTYQGIDEMGLFYSMKSQNPQVFSFKNSNDVIDYSLSLWIEDTLIDTKHFQRLRGTRDIRRYSIQEKGIVATLFLPNSDEKLPVIITLAGSNGGLSEGRAQMLANHGFATLALGYFGVEGLPDHLENIPLEYFEKAFQWIAEHPKLDEDRIGLMGASRGGELALLLGAVFPEKMRAICAISPSSVINAGFPNESCDAWLFQGVSLAPSAPVGYLSEDSLEGKEAARAIPLISLFLEGMSDLERYEKSAIPVEKVVCPVLIIYGGDDKMWPASVYASQIIERLNVFKSKTTFEVLKYPKAGHIISIPYLPLVGPEYFHPVSQQWYTLGGRPEQDDKASRDSWRKLIAFFEKSL